MKENNIINNEWKQRKRDIKQYEQSKRIGKRIEKEYSTKIKEWKEI